MKILHIVMNDKFIAPFIDFVDKHFDSEEHMFIYWGGFSREHFNIHEDRPNVKILEYPLTRKRNLLKLSKFLKPYMEQANRIILHSLFHLEMIDYLYLHQKYLRKCYWAIWGGDLYDYVLAEKSLGTVFSRYRKKQVVKKLAGLVTYIKGDYDLARKWYGATGKYIECFMYPSNLYTSYKLSEKVHDTINIQVGNSADPTNNHLEVFEKLDKYKEKNIKVFVPLSYGNQVYARCVIEEGQKMFGNKFVALTDFIPFDQYLELLSDIDIAIFNHKRQQAIGNTITLLGLKKKVYIRSDTVQWSFFKKHDIHVFDVNEFEMTLLSHDEKEKNSEKIKNLFSKERLVKCLEEVFQ